MIRRIPWLLFFDRTIGRRLFLIILTMASGMAVTQAVPAPQSSVVAAIVLVGCIALTALQAHAIAAPITALNTALRQLAAGDLTAAIPAGARNDEVGGIATAAIALRDVLVRNQAHATDLNHQAIQQDKRAALIAMAEAIEAEAGHALAIVHSRTTAMAATAAEMTGSATRTGRAASSASEAATCAIETSQSVVDAADHLAAAISEIGSQVGRSAAAATEAVTAGLEARATIEALNGQVGRIGAVVDIIGAIASQTNMLALNATIEAARAGDAGKGFVVVATEVKSLAAQTAHSTREIARHITDIRTATQAAATAVGRIERVINTIDGVSNGVVAAVEKEAAATMSIAFNVADTASAARDMGSRIAEVSTEAEQTGRYALSVRENAMALEEAVGELRHAVIRVIRTSTTEVNRRGTERYRVNLPCRLTTAGGIQSATIVDLSSTGAQLIDVPAMPEGARGKVSLDGMAALLPFVVRSFGDHGELHVEFEDAEAARVAVAPLLRQLPDRQSAAEHDHAMRNA